MNDTKKMLISKAFLLFSKKRYQLATIKDIEEETGMTRGAIFHYFKDKSDLYRQVINEYILKRQNINLKFKLYNLDNTNSFLEFIESYVKGVSETAAHIYGENGIDLESDNDESDIVNVDRSYIALVLQSAQFYPEFDERIKHIFQLDIEVIKHHLNKSVSSGELKGDINVDLTAIQFRYIFLGLSIDNAIRNGINPELLRKLYINFYELIKA